LAQSPLLSEAYRMIVVEQNASLDTPARREADFLEIEWYEAAKTIIRRRTKEGKDLAIRKNSRVPLKDGDILWYDDASYIQVVIRPCDCIVVKPRSSREMGTICFEIGNMHLPIYIDDDDCIHVAYEGPLYQFLQKRGYCTEVQHKKLLQTSLLTIHELKR